MIRRLTVAVLVNGTTTTDESGAEIFAPLPENELSDLQALVASAVGFDEARGDQITIRSMMFEARPVTGSTGIAQPWYGAGMDVASLIRMGILAAVALAIALFVLRPLLRGNPAQAQAALAPPLASDASVAEASENLSSEDGQTADMAVLVDDRTGNSTALALPQDGAQDAVEDPVDRLRGLIDARKEETVEVLRNWLEEKEDA